MRARDIMTTDVQTVRQDEPVRRAAELLAARSVTALPVLDSAGALVGMVSEGDLLWHRVPSDPTARLRRDVDPDPGPALVADVMSGHPVTTTPDADVAEVAESMLRRDVRSMPVTDGRRVVGIISRRDILRAAVRGDDVLTTEVQHRLDDYAEESRRWTVTVSEGVATIAGAYRDDGERMIVGILARSVPGVTSVRQTDS